MLLHWHPADGAKETLYGISEGVNQAAEIRKNKTQYSNTKQKGEPLLNESSLYTFF